MLLHHMARRRRVTGQSGRDSIQKSEGYQLQGGSLVSVVGPKQVFRVLGGIVGAEERRVFQDQSGRREPCADATVLAEIKHFRQTCESTGFHTCSAF